MASSPYVRIPINDGPSEAYPKTDENSISSPRKRGSPVKPVIITIEDNKTSGPTPQFIKLFGRGPKFSDEPEPGVVLPPRNDRHQPEAIDPNEMIDVIDARNTEEPFTLDAFDELVQMHLDKGKDFILARVTTVDPLDDQRFYYSYYAAHQINRVLFRTQPELGLLHRMKAKNPMNNMTIVGDVHYYVIKQASSPKTKLGGLNKTRSPLREKFFDELVLSPQVNSRIMAIKSNAVNSKELFGGAPIASPNRHPISRLDSLRRNSADDAYSDPPTPLASSVPSLPGSTKQENAVDFSYLEETDASYRKVRSITFHNNRDGARSVAEWVHMHNGNKKRGRSLDRPNISGRLKDDENEMDRSILGEEAPAWEARYFASDDDYLMQASIRAYFKKQALETQDTVLFSIMGTAPSALGGQNQVGPVETVYVLTIRGRNGRVYGLTRHTARYAVLLIALVVTIVSLQISKYHFLLCGLC